METKKTINLPWLCINKYTPEQNINNIKETLLKSGVTFFNLHRIVTRYRKETAEKTNIEQYTNNQNTLAENLADITRRLETIQKALQELKNTTLRP